MRFARKLGGYGFVLAFACLLTAKGWAATGTVDSHNAAQFPLTSESYADSATVSVIDKLTDRIRREPMNAVATGLFLLAILHTFLAPRILRWAHHVAEEHKAGLEREGRAGLDKLRPGAVDEVSLKAHVLHLLGEIEVIFGLWVIPLVIAITLLKGWHTTEHYLSETVHFTEPLFVVVIMTIAGTRPVLMVSEQAMLWLAARLGGSVAAVWFTVLTLGSLLGSLITEPAAMTIGAMLLGQQFFARQPAPRLAYATLGLLFVNVSIGGTLTHFAAPPVLMVAGQWGWGTGYMLSHFGGKSALAIVTATAGYWLYFRKDFADLRTPSLEANAESWASRRDPIPAWITITHLVFLGWTVFTAHHPVFFIGGFLFFLAFVEATEHHQNPVQLTPGLLVGCFLAGLVIHGGLQAWWIAPILESLGSRSLFFGAALLTAFNDNAAITYLASLVPSLADSLKYAVVAGAVVGGGLTVIANAPNPAGQAILGKYFEGGISPLKLTLGALFPTVIAAAMFLLFS